MGDWRTPITWRETQDCLACFSPPDRPVSLSDLTPYEVSLLSCHDCPGIPSLHSTRNPIQPLLILHLTQEDIVEPSQLQFLENIYFVQWNLALSWSLAVSGTHDTAQPLPPNIPKFDCILLGARNPTSPSFIIFLIQCLAQGKYLIQARWMNAWMTASVFPLSYPLQ